MCMYLGVRIGTCACTFVPVCACECTSTRTVVGRRWWDCVLCIGKGATFVCWQDVEAVVVLWCL